MNLAIASSSTSPRLAKYKQEKAEAMRSFTAFTRGEIAVPAYPLEVFLEVSNLCNAKCVMCAVFSGFNPHRLEAVRADQRGHMLHVDDVLRDEKLFAHALNVHLFGFGEPTIHPRFQELVRHVGQYEVVTDFFTNGMKLTDEGLIDTLLEARVERVTLSFSGHTKELYENVYLGCSWDRVLAGLRMLAEKKAQARTRFPELHINSLGWEHHLASLDQFVSLMAEHGANVISVKQLLSYEGIPQLAPHVGRMRTEKDLARMHAAMEAAHRLGVRLAVSHGLDRLDEGPRTAPARREQQNSFMPIERFRDHAATVELKKRRPEPLEKPRIPVDVSVEQATALLAPSMSSNGFHCMEPFKTLYVRQQGLVKPCCFMTDQAHALGDLSATPALDVWQGPGFGAMRRASRESVYPDTGCGQCVRNKDGPPAHYAEQLFPRYAEWFEDVFGEPFGEDPGLLVHDSRTVAELRVVNGRMASVDTGPLAEHAEGFLDVLCREFVDGWVWWPSLPDVRLPVTVWIDQRPVGKAVASDFRSDVQAAGKGDGRYGFHYRFPDNDKPRAGSRVSVTVGDTVRQLQGSPRAFAG